MKVLIPAGGKGIRLRPHTLYTPKPLLFVAGDTIIGHIFSLLDGLEIEEYRIVYSPETSLPRSLKEAYPDRSFSFWEQAEPLGLGHAVLQGLTELGDEPILILLSDTIIPFDIQKAISDLGENEGFLVAKEVADPRRFGVMELSGDYVSKVVEKSEDPQSNLAISGIYYLSSARRLREALEELIAKDQRTQGEYQLTDALSILIERGEKLKPVKVDTWLDCGTPAALLEANRALLKLRSRVVPVEGSLIKPPCWIGDDITIENSIIGPNVSIAKGAVVRNSIVSESIINAGAQIEGMVIKDTIVGERAVLRRSPSSLDVGSFSRLEGF
ncbi:nucleotidyl transferase [candidate division TA06 bacterium B3_TA06]|uniref:Nucleotidyl transferase n=1 Tax=candidate division TA06 bacterium B3_TA06 TaxID=2012487 RepID=A0A532V7C5_UNCT6|nr:MAG: nucleotidyl transferase [candidate division TA06 bacterium B3_TA06]